MQIRAWVLVPLQRAAAVLAGAALGSLAGGGGGGDGGALGRLGADAAAGCAVCGRWHRCHGCVPLQLPCAAAGCCPPIILLTEVYANAGVLSLRHYELFSTAFSLYTPAIWRLCQRNFSTWSGYKGK